MGKFIPRRHGYGGQGGEISWPQNWGCFYTIDTWGWSWQVWLVDVDSCSQRPGASGGNYAKKSFQESGKRGAEDQESKIASRWKEKEWLCSCNQARNGLRNTEDARHQAVSYPKRAPRL
jgi:hypothetical protein